MAQLNWLQNRLYGESDFFKFDGEYYGDHNLW